MSTLTFHVFPNEYLHKLFDDLETLFNTCSLRMLIRPVKFYIDWQKITFSETECGHFAPQYAEKRFCASNYFPAELHVLGTIQWGLKNILSKLCVCFVIVDSHFLQNIF